jgi:hypothetical protein
MMARRALARCQLSRQACRSADVRWNLLDFAGNCAYIAVIFSNDRFVREWGPADPLFFVALKRSNGCGGDPWVTPGVPRNGS